MTTTTQRVRPPHDFDATTLRCKFCGAQATSGLIVCSPHPDYLDEDGNDVRRTAMTLTDFLLARIAEDEAVARAGISGQADPENGWGYGGFGSPRALTPHVGIIHEAVQAEHVIRWHPARVLAECEAKRRIVGLHGGTYGGGTVEFCVCCGVGEQGRGFTDSPHATEEDCYDHDHSHYPCATLLALALPYADHPDFREEWRP